MMRRRVEGWHLAMAVLAVALLAGCGDVTLESNYRDQEITIDGNYSDWRELEYKEKLGMSIGVMNDDEFMYAIIVVRNNELQRRIFLNGMILWFDPAGEKAQQFGIHYPMGLPIDPSQRPTRMQPRPTPEELRERREKMLAEYEVIAEGGQVRKVSGVSIHDVPGIEVDSGGVNGMSIFEYKIPLKSSADVPYAIGVAAGAMIGFGLVTPELDHEAMQERTGGGHGNLSGGGRGDGAYGGRGGSRGAGHGNVRVQRGAHPMSMANPVKVWGTLQLASE